MDGREGMALSGSAPYYLHRTLGSGGGGSGGAGTSAPPNAFSSPTGFRNLSNSNPGVHHHQVQPNFRGGSGSVGPSAFNVEGSPANFSPHGFSVTVPSPTSGGASFGGGGPGSVSELRGKKKRGRPRKYAPDGSGASGTSSGPGAVSLGLSPLSSPNSSNPSERKKRGRPPGSGRKQRLASVGEWMSSSAGVAFTPHVIYVAAGEDIAAKILAFAQQRPRALCIMSACGGVSAVTLRSPTSAVGAVTYEGRFEILCLSGSYLVTDGTRNRTGGVNVSLSSHEGLIIGGSVGGRLMASRPVQVVVCSFVYGDPKAMIIKQPKPEPDSSKGEENPPPEQGHGQQHHNSEENRGASARQSQANTSPSQPQQQQQHNISASSNAIGWPGSKPPPPPPMEGKNPNTDIDLMRG